uniref:flagellar FliJ family protein n=1 Tax=Pararhizobium sp. IMCC3301 TaxID=3067904 RepID=UPI00274111DF|nr:flagellar FliJ family protein [Pararhizobium sp. IMCC3301]
MKSRESLIKLKRFQVDEKRKQLSQIESMITDFQVMADELDAQVISEQQRTGIEDVTHYAYSTFARAATQRRANLITSIEDLDKQRSVAHDVLSEAVEDLKKVELLAERDLAKSKLEAEWADQEDMDEIANQRHRGG